MNTQRLKEIHLRLRSTLRSKGGISELYKKTQSTLKTGGWSGVARKAFNLGKHIYHQFRATGPADPRTYTEWRARYDTLAETDWASIRLHIESMALPQLLLIVKLDDAEPEKVHQTLASLQSQLYTGWRAVVLLDIAAKVEGLDNDVRFTFVTSSPSNIFSKAESAKHVFVIAGPVVLREHALYMFALEALQGARFAYADSDRLMDDGHFTESFFKPDYSPELAVRLNYFGCCAMLARGDENSTELLAGFMRGEMKVSELFRIITASLPRGTVAHIPFVLFHELDDTRDARLDLPAPWLPDVMLPRVSIIIPTRDRLDFLEPCVMSILGKSDYPREKIEILIVDNASKDADILQYMSELQTSGAARIIHDPRKFNFASLNNGASRQATGEVLLFLNNDTVVDDTLWLKRLTAYSMQQDVGAVGGKLLYPDRTVQHGGIVLGIQGVAAHAHHHLAEDNHGYHYLNSVAREMAAVTGACLAMRKSVFEEVGGFDENLAIAFNDVVLCLDAVKLGYRNIFIAEPLLIHHESKTRGFDHTSEKMALFRKESSYARDKHRELFANDPYYNPNMSLERVYDIARPPRAPKPWSVFRRECTGKLRILMLSITHQVGHGVAVVVDLQSRYLAEKGHEIFVGGPQNKNEFQYEGCERVYLTDPMQAAEFAVQNGIDCVIAHTPPYFSTFRWLGSGYNKMVYDYGEPNPEFFPEKEERRAILAEKKFCLPMADRLYAISKSVRDETADPRMAVIRIANSHLTVWNSGYEARRLATRDELQWQNKFVVLNVCRFHKDERYYKGIDAYSDLLAQFRTAYPELMSKVIFALCGKGTEQDVSEMQARGLTVFANVSDQRLIDMYCAADAYVNMSKWEGYNLGIGQAMAMGLPVIASDIPAHREFGVFTSNDYAAVSDELKRLVDTIDVESQPERTAKVWEWSDSLKQFEQAIDELVSLRPAHRG